MKRKMWVCDLCGQTVIEGDRAHNSWIDIVSNLGYALDFCGDCVDRLSQRGLSRDTLRYEGIGAVLMASLRLLLALRPEVFPHHEPRKEEEECSCDKFPDGLDVINKM